MIFPNSFPLNIFWFYLKIGFDDSIGGNLAKRTAYQTATHYVDPPSKAGQQKRPDSETNHKFYKFFYQKWVKNNEKKIYKKIILTIFCQLTKFWAFFSTNFSEQFFAKTLEDLLVKLYFGKNCKKLVKIIFWKEILPKNGLKFPKLNFCQKIV